MLATWVVGLSLLFYFFILQSPCIYIIYVVSHELAQINPQYLDQHKLIMERTCFPFLLCVSLFTVQFYMASLVIATLPNITTDQYALLALKAQISYDPYNVLTNNWSTGSSICNWVGITCGSRHRRVTALNLPYMDLVGTIPPHIGNLSFLVSLNIENNSFHGSLPNELSYLYRLQHLSFGFNDFSGKIPSGMGSFSKLQNLSLYGNRFSGTIPPSLSNISSLKIIDLGYNQLSGSIPSSIFNIYNLQGIYLRYNLLSGPMPSNVSNMSSLQVINLRGNKLSGPFPMDMFDNLPNLRLLRVSYNQFYGQLTSTLFKCKQLQYLSLANNNFNGSVPLEIGNLIMLKELNLGNNVFGGMFSILSVFSHLGSFCIVSKWELFCRYYPTHIIQVQTTANFIFVKE